MTCPKCNQKNDDKSKFCSNCGKELNTTTPSQFQKNKQNFFTKYIYNGDRRFLLSTLALIFGIIIIGSSISSVQNSLLEAGWAIVFGVIAYKSAKKRRLNLVASTKKRISLEVAAVTITILIIFTQSEISHLVINDPFPNLIIPIWILIAYVVVSVKKSNSTFKK